MSTPSFCNERSESQVLGFAKAFSQPIATFVLMLSTIFYDLRSFMLVLGMITAMFGQAFLIVLAVPDDEHVEDELAPPVLVFQRVCSHHNESF